MTKFVRGLAILVSIKLLSTQLFAAPNCSASHCSSISVPFNAFCVANKLEGRPVLVVPDNGVPCLCTCSCFTLDTLLDGANGEQLLFDEIEKGAALFNPYSKESAGLVGKKLLSRVKSSKILMVTLDNGSTLKVSDNHVFLNKNEETVKARDLKKGVEVLDSNRSPVAVVEVKMIKDFSGSLGNLIIEESSNKATDHIISTNNILSGDWLLQAESDSVDNFIAIRSGSVKTFKRKR